MKRILVLCFLLAGMLCACTAGPGPSETTFLPDTTTEPVSESSETEPFVESTAAETTEPAAETTEPAPEPEDGDFVRILDYIPTARVALAYATEENFTGTVIYDFTDAYLRYGTLKKLMQAADLLEEKGLGLVIWDAYRPVYAQQRLWDAYPDPAYVSPPGTGVQSHCRGIAVDISLYDLKTGEALEMPTGFDDFTHYADRNYSDNSEEAAENARLLEEIMTQCGFKPYSAEWWHFTDADSYEIEYDFDPAQIKPQ